MPGLRAYQLKEEERKPAQAEGEKNNLTPEQKSPGEASDEAKKELFDWCSIEEDEKIFVILRDIEEKCENFPKLLEDIVATHGEKEGRALQDIRWKVKELLDWLKTKMNRISDPFKRIKNIRSKMFPTGIKNFEIAAALHLRNAIGDEKKFKNLLENINCGDNVLAVDHGKIEELYDELLEENEEIKKIMKEEDDVPEFEIETSDGDFPPDKVSGTS